MPVLYLNFLDYINLFMFFYSLRDAVPQHYTSHIFFTADDTNL